LRLDARKCGLLNKEVSHGETSFLTAPIQSSDGDGFRIAAAEDRPSSTRMRVAVSLLTSDNGHERNLLVP
jgi:hypothetical protein